MNLTHHFLIAMPNMADPYFAKTLTYICEHNDQGALGLVVNRPIDMTLQALFERLSLTLRDAGRKRRRSTSAGRCGPGVRAARARRQLAVDAARARRHRPHHVKDILEAVGRGEGPSRILVTLGYAGWSPGQLEHELAQNAWLTVEARDAIIFDALGGAPAGGDGAPRPRLRAVAGRGRACLSGTVLAFDFGLKRIGVAVGETELHTAHPLPAVCDFPRFKNSSTNGARPVWWSACLRRRAASRTR